MAARAMAQFNSEGQAREAYFGDDANGGRSPDAGVGWADPEEIDILEGNWFLLQQFQIEGDRTRYFVLVGPDPNRTLAMRRGGGTVEVTIDDTFDDLPSMDTEDDARAAHIRWMENYQDPQEEPERNEEMTDSEGNQWSEWEVIEDVPPWFVFARIREDGDAFEIVIAGQHPDGHEVYLHPGGTVEDVPYIYTDFDSVESALEAYFVAVERGSIPEDQQPTGTRPDDDAIGRAAGMPGGGSGTPAERQGSAQRVIGRFVRFVARNPRLVLVVLVIALLVHRQLAPADNPIDNLIARFRRSMGGANVAA